MTDYFRRRRPSDFDPTPETKGFAGVQHRTARPDQTDRATAGMTRSHRDRKLGAKLDALLGPVDPDSEEDES